MGVGVNHGYFGYLLVENDKSQRVEKKVESGELVRIVTTAALSIFQNSRTNAPKKSVAKELMRDVRDSSNAKQ